MHVIRKKQKEFMQLLRGLLEPTRVRKGCLAYNIYQDVEDEDVFTIVEEWEDRDKITKYLKSDDFMKLFSSIDILCFQTPDVKFHTVSESAGIEFIESALGG